MEQDGNITERRKLTRGNIYRYLYDNDGFCSKQTLSRQLNLSLPTVYQNLTELVEAGLVRYSGQQQSTGGRRAQGLEIVPDYRYAVGMSLTENRLRMVQTDLRLHELAYKKVPHANLAEMEDISGFLSRELEQFLDEQAIPRDKLLGVGLTLPAVISPTEGRITFAPTLSLRNTTLNALTEKFRYPCYVENDATSDGFAEWFVQPERRDLAYLLLESGVGGAVIVNGTQYHGDNRRSGEFGHMCVEPGGLTCHCGKHGCLEAYCSARRISDDLGITVRQFFAGLQCRDPEYEAIWEDLLDHLATGIVNIRMALDCDVVLGGFLAGDLEPYFPRLKAKVAQRNTFENNADYLRLSRLSRHSVPLGVALHFVSEFIMNL